MKKDNEILDDLEFELDSDRQYLKNTKIVRKIVVVGFPILCTLMVFFSDKAFKFIDFIILLVIYFLVWVIDFLFQSSVKSAKEILSRTEKKYYDEVEKQYNELNHDR